MTDYNNLLLTLVSLARFRILQSKFFSPEFEGVSPLSSISIVAVKKSIIICGGFLFYLYFFTFGNFYNLFIVPKCYLIS